MTVPTFEQSTSRRRARRQPVRRSPAGIVADVLLWALAVMGTVCIVLVILALTAQLTLVMFRTGSMSPTIPAGSVALVQKVPADQIVVGDVVTVDRDGELPITHRVTSVESLGSDDRTRITMRGDANAQDDPAPYDVSTARIVRFSVPGIANAISVLQSPGALAAMTVAASALIFWAFWPRRSGPSPSSATKEEAP